MPTNILDGISSVTGTSSYSAALVDLEDRDEHAIEFKAAYPYLRVVIEDILPSLAEIDKRLSSPIFCDGIREV